MVRANESSSSSKSLTIIAFVLAIAALYLGRSVFIPLALALVLSFLLTPFVVLLEKIRFGRVPSVITVMTLSFVLIGAATWGIAGQLVEIMADLPDYKANLDTKIKSLHFSKADNLSKATATVQELNKELSAVPGQVANSQSQKDSRPLRPVPVQVAPQASNLVQDLGELLGPLAGPLETAIIAVIFVTFMLVKREDLRNRAIRLAGRGHLSVMTQAFDDAGSRLSRYLLLQCLVNAGYGFLFGLGLYFIGIPHARLWGFVAALLRFVPYLGTYLAAAFPVAMAIAVFPGWRQAGIAFVIFLALDLTVSNVVEPTLYGGKTGISPLAILVAAVFWTTLWGPVGLILSTPLTVCLVVLGRYVPQLNFLEVVLGDEPALPPEQLFYQRLLAGDQEEARTIAETFLKDHPVESLYESIIVPALRLAEQDYYIDGLDDDARRFILRSVRELIEDVGDRLAEDLPPPTPNEKSYQQSQRHGFTDSYATIACVPVRSGSDELVAIMLAQLLRSQGFRALHVRCSAMEDMVAEVSQQGSTTVCLSCLPPIPTASARSLCKRFKANSSRTRVIVGAWHLDGGVAAARDRVGTGCPDLVITTLAEALSEVHRLTIPEPGVDSLTEKR